LKVVYFAGPIRNTSVHKWLLNILKAWVVARYYLKTGYSIICPHTMTAFMDGVDLPTSAFFKSDNELIRRCDMVVMLPDWETSEGATAENALAKELGKEIRYVSMNDICLWIANLLRIFPGEGTITISAEKGAI